MKKLIAATLVAITMDIVAADGAEHRVIATPVVRTDSTSSGQPIVLPHDHPEVAATLYDVPPRTRLPAHRHAHIRYVYVLSGRLRVTNFQAGTVESFSPGDFVVEPLQQWHVNQNPDDAPLRILVIDQSPTGDVKREPKS